MTSQKAAVDGPFSYFALEQYRFIRASGPDAKTFLQGQVTCDTNKISANQSVPGALCNLKGRVIADFRALEIDGDILLQVSADLQDKMLATLKKYAVFSKLTLSVEDNIKALGLHLAADADRGALHPQLGTPIPDGLGAAASLANGGAILRTELRGQPFMGVEVWAPANSVDALSAELDAFSIRGDTASWVAAENLSGIAHVTEAMSEEYTPALLNYDLSGVVDFKKGCYTGQEIVARMFYRSTPKKRLFALKGKTPLNAPLTVMANSPDSENLGDAFSIAAQSALAILPIDAAQRSLTSSQGEPLEALELNYAASGESSESNESGNGAEHT